MSIIIRMDDNTDKVLRQLEDNVVKALTAMGEEAVGMIVGQMRTGYGRPIWRTGDLQRDVSYDVRDADHAVDVGNGLEYGPYVHEGTYKMAGRPYITDALTGANARDTLMSVAEEALKEGF